MKSLINYLLTITLFIIIIITIIVFTIDTLTNPNSTKKILDNLDYNIIISDLKKTNYGSEIYNYANNYEISEEKVDSILQTNETKNYINEVLQQSIDSYLNNETIKINNKTIEFINKINEKYKLNLDDNQKNELETNISQSIDNLNIALNNSIENKNVNSSKQFLIDIIKICKNNNLRTTLYLVIGIITLLLFISSFKKKNFLEYISIISITVAISTLLFNGLISLISKKMDTFSNTSIILTPVTNAFYTISFIGIVLGIILLIIQHFINKQVNKEIVPF